MADFNWYLNRQGLRGLTGEKGDKGFSPYFTVEESTANQYRLRVHNENDSFVTENLRGNAIEIRNPDGNYIKYDHNTGDFYVDDADYATVDSEGQVILATINDVVIGNETKAVTPSLLLDSLSQILVNSDNNLSITQNQDNSLTEIKLADEVIHPNLKHSSNDNYLITGDIRYNSPIKVNEGVLDDTGRKGCTFDLVYDSNHFDIGSQGLTLSNSIVNFINSTRSDLDSEISNRESAISNLRQEHVRDYNDLGNRLQNEATERSRQDSLLQSQINSVVGNYVNLTGNQTIDGIKKFTNMLEFNENVSFGKRGGYSGATIIDNNRWLRFNAGRLSVGHVENDSYSNDAYFLTQSNITNGDNITIEKTSYGIKISATGGGGGGGTGDVTAAGNNRFTGDNTFIGKVNIAGGALTVDGLATLNQTTAQYLNAVSITSSGEINAVSIKANGLRSDDIQTTENKKYLTELDVDNQTIQVVNGKLHANLDELGNEVNDLTQRVNNIESSEFADTSLSNINDAARNVIQNAAGVGNIEEALNLLNGGDSTLLDSKQDTLISGTNIKTINNESILGEGNITISGGGGVEIDDVTPSTTTVYSSSKCEDILSNKLDASSAQAQAPYLKTTYINGTSGYNIWSNGYCEQWGDTGKVGSSSLTVSFIKRYDSTNYIVQINKYNIGSNNDSGTILPNIKEKYDNSIVIQPGNSNQTVSWKVCGYLAQGEY